MILFWMGCSASEMKTSTDSYEYAGDSGYYEDTGLNDETAMDTEEVEIPPVWKKISINLVQVESEWTALLWEDLYTTDMEWLCQRQIEYGKVEALDLPTVQLQSWFRMSQPNMMEESSTCTTDLEIEGVLEIGLGDLHHDVSVATEVTHWLEDDVNIDTESMLGAYIMENSENIWAFGIGYQSDEQVYHFRTVYSLPF
jgi:hypothetical protein